MPQVHGAGMTPLVLDVLLAAVLIMPLTLGMLSNCKFPDVMQTKDSPSWWLHHVTYAGAQTTNNTIFYVDVIRDKLSVTVLSGSKVKDTPRSFERLCFRQLQGDKFLVRHFEKHLKGSLFACMQFVKRSDDVIQWKQSILSKSDDDTLCDDAALIMDPWPLVRYETSVARGRLQCPISGGYSVQLVDSDNGELCTEKYTSARLEIGCRDDAMLHLDFHTCHYGHNIVGMEIRQKLQCVGHWQDGRDSYVILKRNGVSMFWILHLLERGSHTFHGYLSSDVVVEKGHVTTLSGRYVKVILEKRVYLSTCDDVSNVCQANVKTCDTERVFADMYCRHTCGRCNSTDISHQGERCESLKQLAGEWNTLTPSGAVLSIGTDLSFGVDGVMSQCIEYDAWTSTYSMLHFSDNGCYPRYHCLTVHPVTPGVLLYRYSQGPHWPVFGAHNLCSAFMRHNSLTGTAHHFHLALMTSQLTPIPCGFLYGTFSTLVVFADGGACHGHVFNPDCDDKNSSKITIHHSKCNEVGHEYSYNITCLAQMPSISSRRLLLVAKDTDPIEYFCIYFSSEMSEFVALPGDKCHEVYKNEDVRATYHLTPVSSKCPLESDIIMMERSEEIQNSQNENAPTENMKAGEDGGEGQEKYSNDIREFLAQSSKGGDENYKHRKDTGNGEQNAKYVQNSGLNQLVNNGTTNYHSSANSSDSGKPRTSRHTGNAAVSIYHRQLNHFIFVIFICFCF